MAFSPFLAINRKCKTKAFLLFVKSSNLVKTLYNTVLPQQWYLSATGYKKTANYYLALIIKPFNSISPQQIKRPITTISNTMSKVLNLLKNVFNKGPPL